MTKNYIDGIAVHWYWDQIFPANLLTETHNNFPDKFILATEACVGNYFWKKVVIISNKYYIFRRQVLPKKSNIRFLAPW